MEPVPAAPPAALIRLAGKLAGDVARGTPERGEPAQLDTNRYLDPRRLADEVALMRQGPVILGHAAELPRSSRMAVERLGLPLLLSRDADGQVHGHYNVCRHRGMRLAEPGAAACRNHVCPYHGWTYALDGSLTGLPHRDCFDALPQGLRAFPLVERHGLLWGWPALEGKPAPQDLDPWLGGIGAELDWFGIPQAAMFRRVEREQRCNWKLIVEAFLEGYHIRVLHRNTIFPFFLDACAVSQPVGPHFRSAAARRGIAGRAADAPLDLRQDCTFTHYLFPNTILIFHPDYTSLITLWPLAADRVTWSHTLLVPAGQMDESWRAHWEKSFGLIEQGVFQKEDLYACEGIQAGMASGANAHMNFGRLEYVLPQFHAEWDRRLAATAQAIGPQMNANTRQ
jgi:phenylpropionate dioxygenase-like ring-hydroxylating dioxygenase large terminal subunit